MATQGGAASQLFCLFSPFSLDEKERIQFFQFCFGETSANTSFKELPMTVSVPLVLEAYFCGCRSVCCQEFAANSALLKSVTSGLCPQWGVTCACTCTCANYTCYNHELDQLMRSLSLVRRGVWGSPLDTSPISSGRVHHCHMQVKFHLNTVDLA